MIRSSVTVSLVEEARGGPFVFWHDLPAACQKARDLGFDAVEVFPPAPDAVDPAVLVVAEELGLREVFRANAWLSQRRPLHLEGYPASPRYAPRYVAILQPYKTRGARRCQNDHVADWSTCQRGW